MIPSGIQSTANLIPMNESIDSDRPSAERPPIDHVFLQYLRRLGFIEGLSTLVLFGIAMPLKYMAGMPMAVRIVGSLHGFLFIGLVAMLLLAVSRVPISRVMAFTGIIAAVVPFGPFVFDRWLVRSVA